MIANHEHLLTTSCGITKVMYLLNYDAKTMTMENSDAIHSDVPGMA